LWGRSEDILEQDGACVIALEVVSLGGMPVSTFRKEILCGN